MSLRSLVEFIEWVDYCYGLNYEERYFREEEIPRERVIVDTRKIKEQESLLGEKDAEIEASQENCIYVRTVHCFKEQNQRAETLNRRIFLNF